MMENVLVQMRAKLTKIVYVLVKDTERVTIVAVVFILKNMIRIRRLVKKSTICDIIKLPYVAKIELLSRKANQKNPNIISAYIYLNRSLSGHEMSEFKIIMNNLLQNPNIPKTYLSIIHTAIIDGFIKESAYDKLKVPMDIKYHRLCRIYSQDYFYNLDPLTSE